jgi:hypothetical protein
VRSFEFTIPGDVVKDLSPNQRLHWRTRNDRAQIWKHSAWLSWANAGRVQFSGKVRITYTIRRGRVVDPDNALASAKSLLDGLAFSKWHKERNRDAMIQGDGPQWVEFAPVRQEIGALYRDRPEVLVQVEELDNA